MGLEKVVLGIALIVAAAVGIIGLASGKSRRRVMKWSPEDITPTMPNPPGTEAKPVADVGRELLREAAAAEESQVDDVTGDPTPPTDGAGISGVADGRRARRERGDG